MDYYSHSETNLDNICVFFHWFVGKIGQPSMTVITLCTEKCSLSTLQLEKISGFTNQFMKHMYCIRDWYTYQETL